MTLKTISGPQQLGNPKELYDAFVELRGLKSELVTGAAAGTAMACGNIGTEDTILSAVVFTDAGGSVVDDKANITIQSKKASATLTITGNPVADETVSVNGVTYTWKAVPTAKNHVLITAGNNTAMAASLAAAINAYEARYESQLNGDPNRLAAVVATSAAGVVTVTSIIEGAGNGPIVSDTGTTITISSTNPGAVTATFVSAANTDAIIVNGVTFTIKTVPVNLDIDMGVKGSDTLQAAETVRIINAYETKYGTLNVVASAVLGVVTLVPRDPKSGNAIPLTEASSNIAASGSGYLAGGSAAGSLKSVTNLAAKKMLVTYFDKR